MKANPDTLDQKLKEAGYKFLGWQNGWKRVFFDEDGKQTTGNTSKGEKPRVSFGYTKEDYPEYAYCREQNTRLTKCGMIGVAAKTLLAAMIAKFTGSMTVAINWAKHNVLEIIYEE